MTASRSRFVSHSDLFDVLMESDSEIDFRCVVPREYAVSDGVNLRETVAACFHRASFTGSSEDRKAAKGMCKMQCEAPKNYLETGTSVAYLRTLDSRRLRLVEPWPLVGTMT